MVPADIRSLSLVEISNSLFQFHWGIVRRDPGLGHSFFRSASSRASAVRPGVRGNDLDAAHSGDLYVAQHKIKMLRGSLPFVERSNLTILGAIATGARDRVLSCLQRNIGHPEAIAAELGLSRAAVDSHLAELVRYGVLERYTVPSQGSKPKTFYRLTPEGRTFLEDLEAGVEAHRRRLATAHQAEVDRLEIEFLEGKIEEYEFRRRRGALKEKWDGLSDLGL